jgi:hypothetical protein
MQTRLGECGLKGLINNIQGIEPNLVSNVTLDNTFTSHQYYRYNPKIVGSNALLFEFTLANWCHVRNIHLNLQYIFRLGGESIIDVSNNRFCPVRSQRYEQDPIWSTAHLINNGGCHITNGGLLSAIKNLKIKMGNQVDIMTAFEKSKCGFHILNTWLRGKWDQKNTFALIDRWDAWYPYNSAETFIPFAKENTVFNFPRPVYTNPIAAQSDCIYERLLSRTLGKCGLLRETDIKIGQDESTTHVGPDRFNEFVENVCISLDKLHSVFQQDIMLPPGIQFIIEFEVPTYHNFVLGRIENFPSQATWANIGHVQVPYGDTKNVVNSAPDDLNFYPVEYYKGQLAILTSINSASSFNSITTNCVNLKVEIARSLIEKRIASPLVYNYNQMVATTAGYFFPGQYVYNFSIPPSQGMPTKFLFAWINPSVHVSYAKTYLGSRGLEQSSFTSGINEDEYDNVAPEPLTRFAYDGPAMDAYGVGFGQVPIIGSSLTPLPVPYKRIVVSRGGYQEVHVYGSYYDGLANHTGFTATKPGTHNKRAIQNACVLFKGKNLTSDSTTQYHAHADEFNWSKCNLNNAGCGNERLKWCREPKMFCEGQWQCIELDPCAKDTGKFSGDTSNYSIDFTIELDLGLTDAESRTMLNENSQFVIVRVFPAQLSIAIDGTVKQHVWPNLMTGENTPSSAAQGPGGNI